MRDRLIELLKGAETKLMEMLSIPSPIEECEDWLGIYADHLLANGVVVLPCKVGDTVYCIWQYSDFAKTEPPFIKKSKIVAFIIDEGVLKVITEDYAEMTDHWHMLIAVAFTQEEAERALKGGEQG